MGNWEDLPRATWSVVTLGLRRIRREKNATCGRRYVVDPWALIETPH